MLSGKKIEGDIEVGMFVNLVDQGLGGLYPKVMSTSVTDDLFNLVISFSSKERKDAFIERNLIGENIEVEGKYN